MSEYTTSELPDPKKIARQITFLVTIKIARFAIDNSELLFLEQQQYVLGNHLKCLKDEEAAQLELLSRSYAEDDIHGICIGGIKAIHAEAFGKLRRRERGAITLDPSLAEIFRDQRVVCNQLLESYAESNVKYMATHCKSEDSKKIFWEDLKIAENIGHLQYLIEMIDTRLKYLKIEVE